MKKKPCDVRLSKLGLQALYTRKSLVTNKCSMSGPAIRLFFKSGRADNTSSSSLFFFFNG